MDVLAGKHAVASVDSYPCGKGARMGHRRSQPVRAGLVGVTVLLLSVVLAQACTVVRFEEQVQSKTLRWGVLTYQDEDTEYAGAYGGAAAAAIAADGMGGGRSYGSGKKVLHIAVIHGSEQYRNAKEFFSSGGADEAQALCILVNEEEENRLARVYGEGHRRSSGGLVKSKAGQRIVELLDAADVILRVPVSSEGGADVLYYQPQESSTAPASGAAQLPGSKRQSYSKIPSTALVGPFSSVEELVRGQALSVRPALGLVMQSNVERSTSFSTNEVRSVTGAVVMGSVHYVGHEETVVLGPYMQLLPRTPSGFDRRIIDELKCTVKVDNEIVSQFRLDTVSGDAIAATMEVAVNQHLRAGSVVLFGLSGEESPSASVPFLPQLLRLFESLFGWEDATQPTKITAKRGQIVKTAMSGPARHVDLGVQANQVVPFNGRSTEFTNWPSIVSHELGSQTALTETISIASDNWLLVVVAVLSLSLAVFIGRLCM